MQPLDVLVSILNLLCGIVFLVLTSTYIHIEAPGLLAITVAGGYLANLVAVTFSVYLLIIYLIRLVNKGNAQQIIADHWLGLFNGAFVIVYWSLYFGFSYIANPAG